MTLKQAISQLGGASAAAAASGIPRTTILYWLSLKKSGVPSWRAADIQRLIELAEQKKRAA